MHALLLAVDRFLFGAIRLTLAPGIEGYVQEPPEVIHLDGPRVASSAFFRLREKTGSQGPGTAQKRHQ